MDSSVHGITLDRKDGYAHDASARGGRAAAGNPAFPPGPGSTQSEQEVSMWRQAHRYGLVALLVFGLTGGVVGVLGQGSAQDLASGELQLGWISFDTPLGVYMKDETTLHTTLTFSVPGMSIHEEEREGVTYYRIGVPGLATSTDIGKPELPIMGEVIEIPFGVDFSLEILDSAYTTYSGYNIFPAQEREIRQGSSVGQQRDFVIDRTTYASDSFYPESLSVVEAQDVGVIRGHRLVFLKVNPFRYNPVTQELQAFSHIEVRLHYDRPAQIERVDRRIEADAFEELLEAAVLNYKSPDRFPLRVEDLVVGLAAGRGGQTARASQGCEYLIIAHATFNPSGSNNPVADLADWKRRKGLTTRVVTTAAIPNGNTAAGIRAYIQTAYDTWTPVPAYVLLVGDSEFVPTNDGLPHPAHGNTTIGTDLRYVTVDGSDYFPDIFIGRLSVDTLQQAIDVVDKILNYERTPPTSTDFYEAATLVCLFEDDGLPNGQEDATFRIIEFAEEIWAFLDGDGYDPERVYDQSGTWPQGPQLYENGAALPGNLTLAGGFPWNGWTADISAAINAGRFVVAYDGHGGRDNWSQPGFDIVDVNALTNGAETPVVFSLACETGWFDNETDAASLGTAQADESLCEHFLRHNNGGSVAIIGSTRISWDNNDFMMLGMFKAIWPDFNPNPPFGPGQLPQMSTGSLLRMGQIDVFSKVYMARRYGHDFNREASFEMYHLFGDPEMSIWTENPGSLSVDNPAGIGATGEQDFVVTVQDAKGGAPVADAQVVLTQGGSIVAVGQTNPGGFVRFTLQNIGSGDADITVTHNAYRPYEGVVTVAAGGGELNRLSPDNAGANDLILVGGIDFQGSETITLALSSATLPDAQAVSGSFGQPGNDFLVTVPTGLPLGLANLVAHGATSGRYAVDVFRVRDPAPTGPIDLYTYAQKDSSTWHLHTGGNPTWNSPDIVLYDASGQPASSNNLTVGHQYTIRATVRNDTALDAQGVIVTFKFTNFGAGQPGNAWTTIGTDQLDVPANSSREAEVAWVPSRTGHECIRASIYHVEDWNENNNTGQENCDIGPTTSPRRIEFTVWNPGEEPRAIFLELRQLTPPGQDGDLRVWGATIDHPQPQIIEPGSYGTAGVTIDPEGLDIPVGAEAEFALTASLDGEILGGVNFVAFKSESVGGDPPIWGDIMAFPTPERFLDADLNGDGDTLDTVLRYKNLETGVVVNTGRECSGAPHGIDIWEETIVFSASPEWAIRCYDISSGTVRDTGCIGRNPAIHGEWIAFAGLDGTIQLFHMQEEVAMETDLAGSFPVVFGGVVAFHAGTPSTIWYYDTGTGAAVDTGAVGRTPAIYKNLIAFSTQEGFAQVDLNGDGDLNNSVIRYYDLATHTVTNTGATGSWPAIFNDVVVFSTYEGSVAADLNSDGKISLPVIQYLHLPSGEVINTGQLGAVPDIYNGTISFHALESWSDFDWSGDGDTHDSVVLTCAVQLADCPLATEPSADADLEAALDSPSR